MYNKGPLMLSCAHIENVWGDLKLMKNKLIVPIEEIKMHGQHCKEKKRKAAKVWLDLRKRYFYHLASDHALSGLFFHIKGVTHVHKEEHI